jgi:hypothetical protein
MHVENVIGRDRWRACGDDISFAIRRCENEAQGRAPAGSTVDLEEREIVPVGEDADTLWWDAILADGARNPVRERAEVVLRIHPW